MSLLQFSSLSPSINSPLSVVVSPIFLKRKEKREGRKEGGKGRKRNPLPSHISIQLLSHISAIHYGNLFIMAKSRPKGHSAPSLFPNSNQTSLILFLPRTPVTFMLPNPITNSRSHCPYVSVPWKGFFTRAPERLPGGSSDTLDTRSQSPFWFLSFSLTSINEVI